VETVGFGRQCVGQVEYKHCMYVAADPEFGRGIKCCGLYLTALRFRQIQWKNFNSQGQVASTSGVQSVGRSGRSSQHGAVPSAVVATRQPGAASAGRHFLPLRCGIGCHRK
jgi:hypothetical protein